jgi:hypothetical protein
MVILGQACYNETEPGNLKASLLSFGYWYHFKISGIFLLAFCSERNARQADDLPCTGAGAEFDSGIQLNTRQMTRNHLFILRRNQAESLVLLNIQLGLRRQILVDIIVRS